MPLMLLHTYHLKKIFCICAVSSLFLLTFTFLISGLITYSDENQIQYKPRIEARSKFHQLIHDVQPSVLSQKEVLNSLYSKPLCREPVLLNIIITSATHHFDKRNLIRNTWCNQDNLLMPYLSPTDNSLFRCTFLIGVSKNDSLNEDIKKEISLHQDILQGNYLDTYRNLTFKVLTGIQWASSECPSKYLLKTDDDCFINTNIFLRVLLKQPSNIPNSKLYIGLKFSSLKETTVIRDPDSKWYVSRDEYAPDYYPEYISGSGYLLSNYSSNAIAFKSAFYPVFSVEDAYIGVLAERAGITPELSYRFTIQSANWNTCNFLYILLIHHVTSSTVYQFQRMVSEAYQKCDHAELIIKW